MDASRGVRRRLGEREKEDEKDEEKRRKRERKKETKKRGKKSEEQNRTEQNEEENRKREVNHWELFGPLAGRSNPETPQSMLPAHPTEVRPRLEAGRWAHLSKRGFGEFATRRL